MRTHFQNWSRKKTELVGQSAIRCFVTLWPRLWARVFDLLIVIFCCRTDGDEFAWLRFVCKLRHYGFTVYADCTAAQALAVLENAEDTSASKLQELVEKRKSLAHERLEVKRELRNETRKRKRLLSKVGKCSVEDLMNAVVIKSAVQAKAKAKAAP